MAMTCGVQHRNDETRARCHNPECRRIAAERGQTFPRTDRPRPPMPAPSTRQITVPDAHGDPIVVDLDRPIIRRRTVTPDTLAQLPPGARIEQCTFRDGSYHLIDTDIVGCRIPEGAMVTVSGAGYITGSTVRGITLLADEVHSEGNIYHGQAILADEVSVAKDHFATPFQVLDGANPSVDHVTVTYGSQQRPASDGEVAERTGAKRGSKGKKAAIAVGGRIADAATMSLFGSPRGRKGRRRRRR